MGMLCAVRIDLAALSMFAHMACETRATMTHTHTHAHTHTHSISAQAPVGHGTALVRVGCVVGCGHCAGFALPGQWRVCCCVPSARLRAPVYDVRAAYLAAVVC